MNSTVEKLLQVDRSARTMVEDARQYYDTTLEEIVRERERIRNTYIQRAEGYLEQVAQTESGAADDAIGELKARYGALTAAMEATYGQNHEAWEETLFARCTGVEREK